MFLLLKLIVTLLGEQIVDAAGYIVVTYTLFFLCFINCIFYYCSREN